MKIHLLEHWQKMCRGNWGRQVLSNINCKGNIKFATIEMLYSHGAHDTIDKGHILQYIHH